MKKQTGIWIDTKEAIIVFINGKETSTKTISSQIENRIYHDNEGETGTFQGNQHVNQEKKFEERKNNQTKDYLSEIIDEIKDVEEIFIFGPAEMKTQLKTKLESNKQMAQKSISIETSDSMSLNQVVAKVKEHYQI